MFRYFNCTLPYGLFAPVSKVTAAPAVSGNTTAATASASVTSVSRHRVSPVSTSAKRPVHNVPVSAAPVPLHERSASRESLSSMSSVTSSASRSRVRLGVTAISKQVVVH